LRTDGANYLLFRWVDLSGRPGDEMTMRDEKGEDVKQSADQSSPNSKKVCN
jgi:hypothetical protein